MKRNKSPEILAPVGTLAMAEAAVYSGAQAIYLGVPGFNARGRTHDHSLDELQEIIHFCHRFGTKVLFAMNVLVFEKELAEIADYMQELISLGADAFIVQDVGLVKFIKEMAPEQVIHGSTQMTTASSSAIALMDDLDIKRFVLSRELEIGKIRQIRENTNKELEVFVHGALCVSYSGQCLTSESFGGRSANRGQCAQSCRLAYDLFVDDEVFDTQGRPYLFSPQDLCGLEQTKELVEMGIESLKIEGRLKTPEYVAAAVTEYSKAVSKYDPSVKEKLASTFSRGLYPGWLQGVEHQKLVDGSYSAHRGIYAGRVSEVSKGKVYLKAEVKIETGDGVELVSVDGSQNLGSTVFFAEKTARGLCLTLDRKKNSSIVEKSWKVYRNHSPKVLEKIQTELKEKSTSLKIPLSVFVHGVVGKPLTLVVKFQGKTLSLHSEHDLELSQSGRGLTLEMLQKELGSLGRSEYSLYSLDAKLQEGLFFQAKALRGLKKQLIEAVKAALEIKILPQIVKQSPYCGKTTEVKIETPKLHVLVRREWQIDALEGLAIDTVYMDFEFGRDYKKGLIKIRSMGFKAGIATLRIHKEGESFHTNTIKRLQPDVVLVRNPGALFELQGSDIELVGDYSLNICNSWSADWFSSKGLVRSLPSYDLNAKQLQDFLQATDTSKIEVNLHHYMPAFHMEHCVFASYLSKGSSWKDCGKPCEKHKVEVKDHKGVSHFMAADQECRNTMFHGIPQTSLGMWESLRNVGVSNFRMECLHESADEVRSKTLLYTQWLAGDISKNEVLQGVGAEEKYGVAEGQLFNTSLYQDRKKKQ